MSLYWRVTLWLDKHERAFLVALTIIAFIALLECVTHYL